MSTFIGMGVAKKNIPEKDTKAVTSLTKQVEELVAQNTVLEKDKNSLEIEVSKLNELNETLVNEKTELETLVNDLTKQVEELTKDSKKNKTE